MVMEWSLKYLLMEPCDSFFVVVGLEVCFLTNTVCLLSYEMKLDYILLLRLEMSCLMLSMSSFSVLLWERELYLSTYDRDY